MRNISKLGSSERKISFVLHEPDNESEGSSNTTVTLQGEEGAAATSAGPVDYMDRKPRRSVTAVPPQPPQPARPFLLRRGTAGTTGGVTTGSFKRRSLKLRRGTKSEVKDSDIEGK